MYRETGKRQAEEKNMKSYIEFLKDKVIKAPVTGIELNPEYYRDGCWYLKREEDNQETPTLFDFMEV